jgi:hypothetical protein
LLDVARYHLLTFGTATQYAHLVLELEFNGLCRLCEDWRSKLKSEISTISKRDVYFECAQQSAMRAVSFVVIMLLRVTVFVRVGVEFADAILRAEIECAALMFALGERLL